MPAPRTLQDSLEDHERRLRRQERRLSVDPSKLVNILTTAARRNLLINPALRTNQDGYVSGTSIPIGSYAFDGMKASGSINTVLNPRASVNTTGWAVLALGGGAASGGITRITTGGPLANCPSFYRATITTAAPPAFYIFNNTFAAASPVVAGELYELSVYVRCSAAVTVCMGPSELNAAGTGIGITDNLGTTALVANTWTRLSTPFRTQAAAAAIGQQVHTTVGTLPIGATFDVTGVMITRGATLYSYFDGDTTDCSWSGTAGGSISYNVPNVVPTLTGAFDPNFGSYFTINANGRVSQIVERSRVPAGTYVATHGSTATMRVYNNTLAPGSRPAFAAGPFPFTADGTDDVVVEFSGGGAGATIGQLRMFAGSTDFGFSLPPIGDELRDCQRHFYKMIASFTNDVFAVGQAVTAAIMYWVVDFPVMMRVRPLFSTSGTLQNYRPGLVSQETASGMGGVLIGSGGGSGTMQFVIQGTTPTSSTAGAMAFLLASAAGVSMSFDARIY